MIYSKHNVFGRIKNSDKWFLINPLWGNADILESEHAERYKSGNAIDDAEFIASNYVVEEEEEQRYYRSEYLRHLDERDNDEVQLFFVPWYTCNFACFYCYQDEYSVDAERFNKEIIDAFFAYIDKTFANRKKYITLFGGEPLLPGENRKKMIHYLLSEATRRKLDTAIVTNGFHLAGFVDEIKQYRIREIQITLDGMKDVHDVRRPLRGGGSSFDAVVSGIDACLQNSIPVNLRMVVDKENIGELPKIARFAIDKTWTQNSLFKTQLGRNYELHHCQTNNQKLFNRLDMYEALFHLIEQHPYITSFHKPAYSISKYLFENGTLPSPLFDSCPGAKNEWAFDYSGHIYACTATVGKKGEELGTYFPNIELYDDEVEPWQDRDVLSIESCKTCNVRLMCGGGCAAVAKVQKGSITKENCRPIEGLLSLGMAAYFVDE